MALKCRQQGDIDRTGFIAMGAGSHGHYEGFKMLLWNRQFVVLERKGVSLERTSFWGENLMAKARAEGFIWLA